MLRKLLYFSCFVLAVVVVGVPASAVPVYIPFLSVDLNGENGPTQAGWQTWNFDRAPATNTFTKTFGSVTVTLAAINNAGTLPQSRNRAGPTGGDDAFLSNVYKDFVYTAHDGAVGLGRDYLKFEFINLTAYTPYEFTFWSYDQSHSEVALKKIAWGTKNPAEWLDAISPGSSYQPTNEVPDAGTYKNPIPTLARVPMAGPWPMDPTVSNAYAYSASFMVTTDKDGRATIYGWADLDGWAGTQHTPANGFAIGMIPEPATIALLGLGGLTLLRRKSA